MEDCLLLLVNLLKNNSSNQNFFKEGSYIQRMKPWFEVGDDNSGWSAQKVTNLHLMLQVTEAAVVTLNGPYYFIIVISVGNIIIFSIKYSPIIICQHDL